ncbi:NCAM1 [Bugula neritina]|uniref:NCAM1 n=1 Tax=Bugula neritina TaxID=10212 RepID=A0A7J7JYL1_BUGNE|nr:NCAM1 [Bugula neritina]
MWFALAAEVQKERTCISIGIYHLINWEVTKGGIQGQYNPVGNYFPKASNNLGAVDFTINVVEAQLPGRVGGLNVTAKTAQSITLFARPPVEENCIPVIGFEIMYKLHGTNDVHQIALFPLDAGSSMKIDNLKSGSSYSVLVYARNERGRGEYSNSKIIETLQSTVPEVVSITSSTESLSNVSHQVVWEMPLDGGEPITQYLVSWREVGATVWNSREISSGSLWWTIPNLQPDTTYEVMVQARNRKGLSAKPNPPSTFRTRPGSTGPSAGRFSNLSLPVEIHYLVIIGVIGLFIILVAIDMICFCSRDWGLLACICTGTSSSPKHPVGDIISLDGADSVTTAGSRDPATHGQENKVYQYNSQQPGGNALTSFRSAANGSAFEEEKPSSHEYINTSRLNRPPVATAGQLSRELPEHNRPYHSGQPVPQPRVPSRSYSRNQYAGEDSGSMVNQQQHTMPSAGDRVDAYRPNIRPYTPTSRYPRSQQYGMNGASNYRANGPAIRPTVI